MNPPNPPRPLPAHHKALLALTACAVIALAAWVARHPQERLEDTPVRTVEVTARATVDPDDPSPDPLTAEDGEAYYPVAVRHHTDFSLHGDGDLIIEGRWICEQLGLGRSVPGILGDLRADYTREQARALLDAAPRAFCAEHTNTIVSVSRGRVGP